MLGTRGGVLSTAYAASRSHSLNGNLYDLGYNWQNRLIGFGANIRSTNNEYRDLGSRYGARHPKLSGDAHFSLSTQNAGSFNLAYFNLRYPHESGSQYLSGGWSKTFAEHLSVSMNVNHDLDDGHDLGAYASLTYFPGNKTSYYTSANRRRENTTYTVGASHPLPSNQGYGWRVQANGGDRKSGYVQSGYQSRYGRLSGGINAAGEHYRELFADATGSLVWMNHDVFAAQRIYQSFAVVSTGDEAGVPVTIENRPAGKTNGSGNLLVTRLNPWQENKIGIKTLHLPADVKIDTVERLAVPRQGAGALVEFPIHKLRAAVVTLVDENNEPLPVGSTAHVNGHDGPAMVVGYDGEVYLEQLGKKNTLKIITPEDRQCEIRFEWRRERGGLPRIGPLTCQLRQSE